MQNQSKHNITFDTQLKTALWGKISYRIETQKLTFRALVLPQSASWKMKGNELILETGQLLISLLRPIYFPSTQLISNWTAALLQRPTSLFVNPRAYKGGGMPPAIRFFLNFFHSTFYHLVHHRLFIKGKISSKYCNTTKTQVGPCTTLGVWVWLYVRGLKDPERMTLLNLFGRA